MGLRGPKVKTGPLDGPFTDDDFNPSGTLPERAKAEYERLVTLLRDSGRLPATDPRMIDNYAICWDVIQTAYEQIQKDGMTVKSDRGNVSKHPLLEVLNAAQVRMNTIMRCLKLTPDSDRSSVTGPTKKGAGETNASGESWDGILKFGG